MCFDFFTFCSLLFLFAPWYWLEQPRMEVSQIQFNFWVFLYNAVCALALNFTVFLVIGRTGAVTIRVAGVLKDWILIALSTVIFPESVITFLNAMGYAIGNTYFYMSITLFHFIFLNKSKKYVVFVFCYSSLWCGHI